MSNIVVVFDLDDTLIFEIDYLKSAYNEIAQRIDENHPTLNLELIKLYNNNINVFDWIQSKYPKFTKEALLEIYRNHFPKIKLNNGGIEVLQFLKTNNVKVGLITDGRSITQRNKIKAIGLEQYFDKVIISEEFGSEKPNIKNFQVFEEFHAEKYFYIADNPKKDFISPNQLKWCTVCILDSGNNIHQQNFDVSEKYLPKYKISSLLEILNILNNYL